MHFLRENKHMTHIQFDLLFDAICSNYIAFISKDITILVMVIGCSCAVELDDFFFVPIWSIELLGHINNEIIWLCLVISC